MSEISVVKRGLLKESAAPSPEQRDFVPGPASSFDGTPGKEETFRCRSGLVYLYLEGPPAERPTCRPAKVGRGAFTVWHEVALLPGQQHTVPPNTLHWFQAGPEGAIVSEFSTHSRDDLDVFTDPDIARTTVVASS